MASSVLKLCAKACIGLIESLEWPGEGRGTRVRWRWVPPSLIDPCHKVSEWCEIVL